jgi:hypothetical protein
MGMPLAELGPALNDLRLVSTRAMDVFDRPDGVTVIDDSYNANPASTAAALHALSRSARAAPRRGSRLPGRARGDGNGKDTARSAGSRPNLVWTGLVVVGAGRRTHP